MSHYLLAVRSVAGEPRPPMSEEQVKNSWQQIINIEKDLMTTGAWVFSGRLHEPDTATVVRVSPKGDRLTTDGPFVESKEHLGGFYIIEVADLDAALAWARRVSAAIAAPIEVRPFVAVGSVEEALAAQTGR